MSKQFELPNNIGVLRLPVGKVVLATVGGKTVLVAAVAEDDGDQTDPATPRDDKPARTEAKATVMQAKDSDWIPVLTPPAGGWTTAIAQGRGRGRKIVFEHTGYLKNFTTASTFSIEGDATTWKPVLGRMKPQL